MTTPDKGLYARGKKLVPAGWSTGGVYRNAACSIYAENYIA